MLLSLRAVRNSAKDLRMRSGPMATQRALDRETHVRIYMWLQTSVVWQTAGRNLLIFDC